MPAPAVTDPRSAAATGSRIPLRTVLTSGLRWDLPASLVVFLVAVPLSLGIAAASGAPVMAGLIAAAIGGIVAGTLGGSPLQVSGPAAGLTVIVAGLIEQFGWPATCAITAAAGVLQALLGFARVGRVALAIAPVVVHAMLAGIGIIIVLQQTHVLLGAEAGESAWQNVMALPVSIASLDPQAAVLGVAVILLLLGWKYMPASLRRIPAPLVAVVAATALSLPLASDVDRITFDGSLLDALSLPQLPSGHWSAVVVGIVTIALVASVESLLSAVAVDRMHHGERTDFNRELVGQGAANLTSGMLGGLPITGVIVRSATNLEAGARTRKSAILHGVWVLVFSLLLARCHRAGSGGRPRGSADHHRRAAGEGGGLQHRPRDRRPGHLRRHASDRGVRQPPGRRGYRARPGHGGRPVAGGPCRDPRGTARRAGRTALAGGH